MSNPPICDKIQACIKQLQLFQSKLLGFEPPADEEERQVLLKAWEGQTDFCCECGETYPRGELVINGHIYCAPCRLKEEQRVQAKQRRS